MSSEQEQELIRAAERVFSGPSAYRRCYSEGELRVHPDLMHDLEEIARHYLATRKAEPVAITEEWLREIGDYDLGCNGFIGWEDDRGWLLAFDSINKTWSFRGESLPETCELKNSDQLLHLLAALGIEVKA